MAVAAKKTPAKPPVKKTTTAKKTTAAAKPGPKTGSPMGDPDTLSPEELKAKYQMAYKALWFVPELRPIFKSAISEEWSDAQIEAAIKNSNWYSQNDEAARTALAERAMGGADWETSLSDARIAVQAEATRTGRQVSQQEIDRLAQDYVIGGWDDSKRSQKLTDALMNAGSYGEDGILRGTAGNLQDAINQIALANGLQLSRGYAEQAARSVENGLSTEEDQLRMIRNMAASSWGPGWRTQIEGGMDASNLASGYINIMANTFDLSPDQISLNDPFLRSAMTKVDDKGNAQPVSLYDFQTALRQDPRWMGTQQAQSKIGSIGMDVLRMMGFEG